MNYDEQVERIKNNPKLMADIQYHWDRLISAWEEHRTQFEKGKDNKCIYYAAENAMLFWQKQMCISFDWESMEEMNYILRALGLMEPSDPEIEEL